MNFQQFFNKATGGQNSYPFQGRFADADHLPHLVRAPTGAGKTATAILGWLWRWQVKKPNTPRRLVYCLPMRVLVEQSEREAKKWIENLNLDVPIRVRILMGGIDTEDWYLHPEAPAILIGTQDMLLSRALNRGYAASRFHWPIDFGLLNNDCLWVFDEPQLMGNGVSTSAQLAGLRRSLGTFGICQSVWMSATLEPRWLDTIDFAGKFTSQPLELSKEDYAEERLQHRMEADKTLRSIDVVSSKDMKDVARRILGSGDHKGVHQPETQTLVVLNTVDRAKAVYDELVKLLKKSETPALLLIHSRFRPKERQRLNEQLQQREPGDRIIIATQVVEAGVDISARTLITELSPWASVVQRIGRCNRTGDDGPGQVFWINLDERLSPPYSPADLEFARAQLKKLNGKDVSPKALDEFKTLEKITLPFEHKHVLRRRDLLDLFDTTPDLSGNDIDIKRFVRSDDPDTDVQVYWRHDSPSNEWDAQERRRQAPRRKELCSVPIGDFKKFLEADSTAYRWDHLDERWQVLGRRDGGAVTPGQVFWIKADQGGYDPLKGWDTTSKAVVPVVEPESDNEQQLRQDTAYDSDDLSHFKWRSIAEHTSEVVTELTVMLGQETGLRLSPKECTVLAVVVRWHDWGKAHPVFQASVKSGSRPTDWTGRRDIGKAPDGQWGRCTRDIDGCAVKVSRFRHELASALGVLAMLANGQAPTDWRQLSGDEQDLAVYLIAAHHGKVRLSVRMMPDEKPIPVDPENTRFAAGVWDGDELPATDLGNGTTTAAVKLDLSPMLLGEGSWTGRMLAVQHRIGPFRLAFLESIVRAADCRASAKAAARKELCNE